jgi:hypothetical protein
MRIATKESNEGTKFCLHNLIVGNRRIREEKHKNGK